VQDDLSTGYSGRSMNFYQHHGKLRNYSTPPMLVRGAGRGRRKTGIAGIQFEEQKFVIDEGEITA
jgi:hypothetical protein